MPALTPTRPAAAGMLAAALLTSLGATASPVNVTVTDMAGKPLADAAVYVIVKGQPAATTSATAEIGQRERQFVPSVTVIQTGTSVSFPNFDTVRHHVYSFAPIRSFELKLYAGTPAKPVVFDKPGTAALGCNVHDRMSAWVHVVDTPIFAKTDARGEATLDVPAGQHLLRAWHFSQGETGLPAEAPLTVGASGGRGALRLQAGS
ncbi:methylamine utilization protein [Aquincola tertiaricarbonis]|uniref:Methylamine utilization protein n=1 Tax=Aquincola tertiaricarbonis TaxID=391953 RepID=A0ABY4SI16_AQUTE|nr:methylamine utilization protein [Aquincola tertiaricarbonis]URI11777.1 methylamine utilization protein [Aquincola tertiaricarbonis]